MAGEREVSAALSRLRALQSSASKRGAHTRDNARVMNVERIRALEGLCGNCVNLDLTYTKKDGKNVVQVGCKRGLNPQTLYMNTPLGQKAECPLFRPERP